VIEAMLQAFKTVPPEMMQQMALTAVQTYMKNGYTTVQEGRADRGTSELWRSLANQNKLAIDVVSYPDISSEQAYMLEKGVSKNYVNHFRIGGVKISLDGSPQGKTAWLTEPYVVPPEGKDKNYRGYPAFPEQKTVQHMIDLAFQEQWPILAHANGDAAIDQYLNVIANAQKKYDASQRRDVIIHAQTMREDQLDRAKQLHLIPSFFSLHTYYWGDWHVAQTLGENGYTTVQEGRADRGTSELWRSLANQNKLAIDVVSYPDISSEQAYMLEKGVSKNYVNHFRIGGVKISLDGSPQGKTAWLTEPYVVPPEGKDKNYRGYPAFPEQKTVQHMIDLAFQEQWPILAHANGDAAIDQYLNVIANAQKKYDASQRRDVIIHAQTMREDQLDRAKQLHLIPSFFSLHTYYWGDWHVAQTLGEKRAEHISPTGSALRKGMIFTEHHDAPVIPPKSMMVLDATVNRTTRTGKVLGETQKVSPYIALKTMTDWAAYQYFEEDIKGTLSTGKYGDFVILSANPITTEPSKIKDIKVLATYKQGQLVYQR